MYKQKHTAIISLSLSLSLIFLLVTPFLALAEESITITTFYPSPYGIYKELRSQRMAIGDNYIQGGTYDWEETDGDGGEIDYRADLVVEGNVGIGTTTPTSKLHIYDTTNMPSPPDITSQVPFKISNSISGILMDANQIESVGDTLHLNHRATGGTGQNISMVYGGGKVGIGTMGPQSKFTVKSAGSSYNAGLFFGGSTAASILPYNGIVYHSAGTYYEGGVWQYYQSTGASLLALTETDGVRWYSGTGASYGNVASNVQLWNAAGTWIGPSSRTLKENFTQLNPDDILQKIDQLDITRWNFKSEGKSITHIGPVAEDFYRIFKTGDSEKKLATMDSVGVSLAGVKVLLQKVKIQQQQIEKLQQEIEELKSEVSVLKVRIPNSNS